VTPIPGCKIYSNIKHFGINSQFQNTLFPLQHIKWNVDGTDGLKIARTQN